nr:MAG TPA: hypothetical protein [Caudoviricetes sp.]
MLFTTLQNNKETATKEIIPDYCLFVFLFYKHTTELLFS